MDIMIVNPTGMFHVKTVLNRIMQDFGRLVINITLAFLAKIVD
jgi:hypothetical protein